MRYATKKEQESISNYIKSISKPTGVNFYDTKEVSIMSNEKIIDITNIQLSDKVNKIKSLPNVDNKDTVVQEIEALELFTEDERASIFGNCNIIWVLKAYSIAELKDKALKALNKPEVNVGDIVKFGYPEVSAVILEVTGEQKDRLSLMYKVVTDYNTSYDFIEGVSVYNITTTDKHVDVDFLKVL